MAPSQTRSSIYFSEEVIPMGKSLAFLASRSLLILPIVSLWLPNSAKAVDQPAPQLIDEVEAQEISVSVAGQTVCAKHPKVAQLFCTDLEQILRLKKGATMIDPANNSQEDLLQVTDEESDAAVAMFGCDCITSINRVRCIRNMMP
jgi:hypothetical protein